MYLKLDTYFLQSNTPATIKLFNGTFDKSENTIDRNRMVDVSLVGNGNRLRVDTTQWREEGGTTLLDFTTGEAGTWVAGVSTRPRNIEMTAADFNGYLEHDGVLDMLEWRRKNNTLDQDAVEKYSKHVKTIFQVGENRTNDWQTNLGYPIEFIPQSNPYDLHAGDKLKIKLLWQGEPLADQLVYVGLQETEHNHSHADGTDHKHEHSHDDGNNHEHSHEHEQTGATEEDHHHHAATQVRTDADGNLTVNITKDGIWYLRTIYLTHSEEAGLTHESNWATLTFEVGHEHSHADGTHSHAEGHHHAEDGSIFGFPGYVYWAGSFVLLLGLFFWFNRKN